MQYLALYFPATEPSGPPNAEHLAEMTAFVTEGFKNGTLLHTGGLNGAKAVRVSLMKGAFKVDEGPAQRTLGGGVGFALLQYATHDEMVANIRAFLELAGDGVSEIIPIEMGGEPA